MMKHESSFSGDRVGDGTVIPGLAIYLHMVTRKIFYRNNQCHALNAEEDPPGTVISIDCGRSAGTKVGCGIER